MSAAPSSHLDLEPAGSSKPCFLRHKENQGVAARLESNGGVPHFAKGDHVSVYSTSVLHWFSAVITEVRDDVVETTFTEAGQIFRKTLMTSSPHLLHLRQFDYWWYWRSNRTWVPYPASLVQIVEAAWGAGMGSVRLSSQEEFSFDRGESSVSALPRHRHSGGLQHGREIRRLPLPLIAEPMPPERILRGIAYRDLVAMEETWQASSHLTRMEREMGCLDSTTQIASMQNTAQQEAGPCSLGVDSVLLVEEQLEDLSVGTEEVDPASVDTYKFSCVLQGRPNFVPRKAGLIYVENDTVSLLATHELLLNYTKHCMDAEKLHDPEPVVKKYTTGAFFIKVNLALAADDYKCLQELGSYICQMRHSIKRLDNGWRGVVYRGQETSQAEIARMVHLRRFYLPSFVSTSKSKEKAFKKNTVFVIDITQVPFALEMPSALTMYSNEEEVLLPCYTRFKYVRSCDGYGDDRRFHMYLKALPEKLPVVKRLVQWGLGKREDLGYKPSYHDVHRTCLGANACKWGCGRPTTRLDDVCCSRCNQSQGYGWHNDWCKKPMAKE